MSATFELLEPSHYILITDAQALNEHCALWSQNKFLALDTEFIRTSTFYPKVGLIQICDGVQNYLIDPLGIDDWNQFKELMLSPSLLKVFHSCTEDLLVFFAFLKIIPDPIFDTQIAAAFLNDGFGLSYQNLVRGRKDIDIPKEQTRSDWLQRPLSAEQFQYAALDVAYLPEIFTWQTQNLEANGKLTWLQEECQRLVQLYKHEIQADFSLYYLNIKSAWQLNQIQLAALKSLSTWREVLIRKRDKPRNWIIKDKELVAVARHLPVDKQSLLAIPGIESSFIRYEGEQILQIILDIKNMDVESYPELLPRPLTANQKRKLKAAQKLAEEKAQALVIPIELLGRKRCLMALYNNIIKQQSENKTQKLELEDISIPEDLQGWRKPHLLQKLFEVLQ